VNGGNRGDWPWICPKRREQERYRRLPISLFARREQGKLALKMQIMNHRDTENTKIKGKKIQRKDAKRRRKFNTEKQRDRGTEERKA
jgi:hypothetical protein